MAVVEFSIGIADVCSSRSWSGKEVRCKLLESRLGPAHGVGKWEITILETE